MPTTPGWKAANNTLPGNLDGVDHAAQLSQFLGTHADTPVYTGVPLVSPTPGVNFSWLTFGSTTDLDQPFVLPGGHTSIGRVTIPVKSVGNGANLFVGLYPDSSGSPNTANLLAGTVVPNSWITNLSALTGLPAAGPLAAARFNTYEYSTGVTANTWAVPGGSTSYSESSVTTSGNFFLSAGGFDGTSSTFPGTVASAQYLGGGVMQRLLPQPTLPQGSQAAGFCTTSNAVLYLGGTNNFGTPAAGALSTVWTASWDPNKGVVGTWTSQTALPTAVFGCGATVSGSTVYVIGGVNSSNSVVGTVYFASVTNGQIGSWSTGPTLPVAVCDFSLGVVNGWLVVAGGSTVSFSSPTAAVTNVWLSRINSDGSLGNWIAGPPLPTAVATISPGQGFGYNTTDSALVVHGGFLSGGSLSSAVQMIEVGPNGVTDVVAVTTWPTSTGNLFGYFSRGDGSFDYIGIHFGAQQYDFSRLNPTPIISVPLPATGLTGGATYHIVLQQSPSSDDSSYLQYGFNTGSLPNDAKSSVRHSGSWSVITSGSSMPMTVFDNTVAGRVLHTWEDATSTGSTSNSNLAARASTLIYNRFSLLLGVCDSVNLPNDALNSNPTFTSGVTNWTPHNCTFVQSNAQVHGGFSFSGLMTPNGVATAPNVTSELVPTSSFMPAASTAQWYAANGWFYSPTGWANLSLSVDWYTSTRVYITTTNAMTSLPVATWTNLVSYHRVPAGAAFASINFIEASTPAASNTVFFSNVMITAANEMTQPLPSVSQVTYSGNWPASGVTQLA